MKRKKPSQLEETAAALLALGDIPYDDAKQMTAAQIRSLYHFDHNIAHADDGPDVFWNLTPRLIAPHQRKTREIDVPRIAKGKRLRLTQAEHVLKMAMKIAGVVAPSLIDEAVEAKAIEEHKQRQRRRWGSDKVKRTIGGKVVPR